MALRVAVANGNWSNPAIWNNGVLPTAGDVIASNGFTVTIDQNINVDRLANTIQSPVIITPVMTSNTTPSGIVTASGIFGSSFQAWTAFNQSFGNWLSNLPTGWLAYEFTSPKVVQIYTMQPAGNNAPGSVPRNWTFEAWDGTDWVILDTVTGNSGTATVSRTLTNTTAYIQYRINITLNNGDGSYTGITNLNMYEANDYTINSVAGGGFILDGTYTITATGQGLVTGSTRLLTYTGSDSVINGNIIGGTSANVETVFHNSTGTLTINGTAIGTANPTVDVIVTNSTGTLNINGNIQGNGRGVIVFVKSACIVNIVGNVIRNSPFSGGGVLQINGASIVNITGNVSNVSTGNFSAGIPINNASAILNITGDVFHNSPTSQNEVVQINQPGQVFITGNVYNLQPNSVTVRNNTNGYLSIVGPIYTAVNQTTVVSGNSGAVNLFSGPFICSPYGFFPYQVVRMHLIPSASSYIEFRDETTGGALAPVPAAPPTQLISPSTLVSNLAISDVRFGTVYAMGTLTGTLRMPTPNQVTFGVAVDDTFGNSVLTAASVWDYLVSNITVEGSIGMRLKNVATPQTIGEQLEAFLRLD